MDRNDVARAFRAWISQDSANPNVLLTEGVELHKGRDIYKSASIRVIGDPNSGVVHRRELKLARYPCRDFGPGYDFDQPEKVWMCEDDQIERIQALLNGQFEEDGHYVKVDKDSDARAVIEQLAAGTLEPSAVATLISALTATPGVADALAKADAAGVLTSAVEHRRQRHGLDELRSAIENPESSEQDLQRILERHWWVFGGRY